MGTEFDPYHLWLAIPPREQPPTHYRLLGLSPFESDRGVIQTATDQRIAHLRSFESGPHAANAQRLLTEVTLAKLVLLNAGRRAAYDVVLRSAAPASALEAPLTDDQRAQSNKNPPAPARPIPINASAPQEFSPGGSLAKYKVLELVAGSAHCHTHKAQHMETGRYYFVKFVPPESLGNREIVKRFERECEILIKLDHPNLIVGYESFAQGGVRYLVMEYVLGTDLATLVKQQGPLDQEMALDYLLQSARGLSQLHEAGVYHRNLKPHVLLVDLQGRLRITNLLLAKIGEQSELHAEELTTMGEAMGSLDYMPPEQAADARKADARADIYALGCVLFHLLLGRPPFVAKGPMQKILAHKRTPPPSLTAVRPETPAWLDDVFQTMLAKDPDERYQNIDELIAALESPAAPWWKRLLANIGLK